MSKRSPKSIGTHAETAVLKQLTPYWPEVRREVLHGHRDIGDIVGCGDFMFEVKGGETAASAGPELIVGWLADTERERKMGGTRFGVLVLRRKGYGEARADRWWAILTVSALADIMGAAGHQNPAPVRLELGDLLGILADQGYTVDTPDAGS